VRKIHIEIYLNAGIDGLELPIHYNHMVQGALYNSIDNDLAEFLHDKGFMMGNRTFKMFSFSRLNGPFQLNREKNKITFTGKIKLVVSSPIDDFCQSLVNILLTRGSMLFGKPKLEVSKVYIKKMEVSGENTLLRPDGRKYTCYFQPGDPDYERLLGENLRKKYQAIYGKEAPSGEVKVKALGRQKLGVIKYKGFIIKGYSGKIQLTGPQSLLQMGVDSGLGSKNSQGFGCVEVEELNMKSGSKKKES